jgi:hypothetical protein
LKQLGAARFRDTFLQYQTVPVQPEQVSRSGKFSRMAISILTLNS